MKTINEMKIDETTLVLLIPLILFSPDRLGLRNRQLILSIQSNYSFLLQKYVCHRYGTSKNNTFYNQNPNLLFNRLLLILLELRSLQEIHSSFLMDVDPSFINFSD